MCWQARLLLHSKIFLVSMTFLCHFILVSSASAQQAANVSPIDATFNLSNLNISAFSARQETNPLLFKNSPAGQPVVTRPHCKIRTALSWGFGAIMIGTAAGYMIYSLNVAQKDDEIHNGTTLEIVSHADTQRRSYISLRTLCGTAFLASATAFTITVTIPLGGDDCETFPDKIAPLFKKKGT